MMTMIADKHLIEDYFGLTKTKSLKVNPLGEKKSPKMNIKNLTKVNTTKSIRDLLRYIRKTKIKTFLSFFLSI